MFDIIDTQCNHEDKPCYKMDEYTWPVFCCLPLSFCFN